MKNIIVGKRSFGWSKRKKTDLEKKIDCIEDILHKQGYIFIETIYEILGIQWNSSNENTLYTLKNGPVEIRYELIFANRYKVTISQ